MAYLEINLPTAPAIRQVPENVSRVSLPPLCLLATGQKNAKTKFIFLMNERTHIYTMAVCLNEFWGGGNIAYAQLDLISRRTTRRIRTFCILKKFRTMRLHTQARSFICCKSQNNQKVTSLFRIVNYRRRWAEGILWNIYFSNIYIIFIDDGLVLYLPINLVSINVNYLHWVFFLTLYLVC